jgi:hypothetical protein
MRDLEKHRAYNREYMRSYKKSEKGKEFVRRSTERVRENLPDRYILRLICRHSNTPPHLISAETIALKRHQVLIKRMAKAMHEAATKDQP